MKGMEKVILKTNVFSNIFGFQAFKNLTHISVDFMFFPHCPLQFGPEQSIYVATWIYSFMIYYIYQSEAKSTEQQSSTELRSFFRARFQINPFICNSKYFIYGTTLS